MLAGDRAPGADGTLIPADIDATIVVAHSDKGKAAPAWKKTYGHHPLAAFADHGAGAAGEALTIMLRPGNAGSSTASEHIEVTRLALAQLPRRQRRKVLTRTGSGGGTHDFLAWLASPGRRLSYSIGMTITEEMHQAILALPDRVWEPAYDAGGQARPGAWVAGLTGLPDLSSWPAGMPVIARKERPHPGAQLRFTDTGGHRVTAFATGSRRGQLADLELRHRRRARCEDRIRCAKDTGLRNLPLHGFAQNQIWCELVAMACELTAWMAMLALDGPARAWEPKRLRLRLFTAAGHISRRRRPPPAAAPRRDLALDHPDHHRDHPPASLRPRLTSPNRPSHPERKPAGPWNPAHPARQPGHCPWPARTNSDQPTPQMTTSRSRKIEASCQVRAASLYPLLDSESSGTSNST